MLLDALLPRLGDGLAAHEVYGEKNNTLAAFVEELHNLLRGKLVWVVRDGRDTVASMHNWHNRLFGNFYRECKDPGNLSDAANACLAQLPLEADSCNTSRPRPLKGDPYYDRWPEMSRHEMLCWYWSHINRRVWERLQTIPPDRWLRVDYSAADRVEEVARAVDFLALCGIAGNDRRDAPGADQFACPAHGASRAAARLARLVGQRVGPVLGDRRRDDGVVGLRRAAADQQAGHPC